MCCDLLFKNYMGFMKNKFAKVPVFTTMSSIPQGCFAAKKCRKHLDNNQNKKEIPGKPIFCLRKNANELMPLQYNSKMMNSIWGLYNRYSVHNVSQHTDIN